MPVDCPPSDVGEESVDKKIISVNISNISNIPNIPLKISPLFAPFNNHCFALSVSYVILFPQTKKIVGPAMAVRDFSNIAAGAQ